MVPQVNTGTYGPIRAGRNSIVVPSTDPGMNYGSGSSTGPFYITSNAVSGSNVSLPGSGTTNSGNVLGSAVLNATTGLLESAYLGDLGTVGAQIA